MSRFTVTHPTLFCLFFVLSACGLADEPEFKGSICKPDPNVEIESCYIQPENRTDQYVSIHSEEDVRKVCQSSCSRVKNLLINQVDGLENLNAFSRLQVEKKLRISSNPVLTSLNGLALEGKILAVSIENNPELTSISGLKGIAGVDFKVEIRQNPKLESLKGLQNITKWGDVSYGGVILYKNGLKNLEGLGGFKGNGTTLQITSEPNLESFRGLGPDVGVLDFLKIRNTPSLRSLEGLEGVEEVQRNLHFEQVPSLPACRIQDFVDRVATPSTDIRIDGAKSSDDANCMTSQSAG